MMSSNELGSADDAKRKPRGDAQRRSPSRRPTRCTRRCPRTAPRSARDRRQRRREGVHGRRRQGSRSSRRRATRRCDCRRTRIPPNARDLPSELTHDISQQVRKVRSTRARPRVPKDVRGDQAQASIGQLTVAIKDHKLSITEHGAARRATSTDDAAADALKQCAQEKSAGFTSTRDRSSRPRPTTRSSSTSRSRIARSSLQLRRDCDDAHRTASGQCHASHGSTADFS